MEKYDIVSLHDQPERKAAWAKWFHAKWGVPLDAYQESMRLCLEDRSPVPQWYAAIANGQIIGGLGVIKNDFHNREDLTPNVCAVYVEKAYRNQGIAGKLLDDACRDMAKRGVTTLYLLTDHVGFYERYGWQFICMVQGDGEDHLSRMYMHQVP